MLVALFEAEPERALRVRLLRRVETGMKASSVWSSATIRGTAGGFPGGGGAETCGDWKAAFGVVLGGVPPFLAVLTVASLESGVFGDA